jgi:gluconolactonase
MFRSCLVAAATFALLTGPALAEKPEVPTLGKIERLDPGLDHVLPADAIIEVVVHNKFDWAEGPVWDKHHHRVLFSDIPKNMIWQWSADGGLKEFLKPSGYTGSGKFTGKEPGSNGLAFNKAGELLLCMHGDRRLAKWVDGKFVTLADRYDGKRLNSPNDLTIKSNGDIYFTDPPYG